MAGTLFVVGTPIGNLEDVTLRALRVLKQVDLVAAEDTRRTGLMLRHHDISTRLVSLHEHNERARIPFLLEKLRVGGQIALVTDAGTPAVSDPGALLVAAARADMVRIEPIPGPAAVTAVMSVAGLSDVAFTFLGFPPTRSGDRTRWFQRLVQSDLASVFFEAPHRVRYTLGEIAGVLADRPVLVAREVTKLHEEIVRAPAHEIAASLGPPRGEYTIVVFPPSEVPLKAVSREAVEAAISHWTALGAGSKRDGAKEIASRLGVRARDVYRQMVEREQG